jgi:Domain of unknown function (DUF6438)
MTRFLVAGLFVLACSPSPKKAATQQGPIPATADSLVLERSICYGTCPAYRLSLSSSGAVRFQSRNPGEETRSATDTTSAVMLPSLVSRAKDAGFFQLPGEIATDSLLCRNRATDHPTVIVSIYTKSGLKRVEDYHGCFETVERGVPTPIVRLRTFENAIDSTLRSSRWIRPAQRGK